MLREEHDIKLIDLNDYEVELYAPHRHKQKGLPKEAQAFVDLVEWADLVVISFAEYNGSYTPVFKNLLDWASTTKEKFWTGKEMILMSTSPGGRGGKAVLQHAAAVFPFMGATVSGTFSLPRFHENFKHNDIVDTALRTQLETVILNTESTPIPEHTLTVKIIQALSPWLAWAGYALLVWIVLNAWLGEAFFEITSSNLYWEVAMYAATFTLIIRPIYDLCPHSDILQALLKWRKGIGLISSSIVVGFWISRNTSLTDITPLAEFFSNAKWNWTLENILERTTEITGLTLFLISNKWMVLHYNTLWRPLQKLAYPYAFGAAALLTFVHEKTYGIICLLLMLVVYQMWFYKRLAQPGYDSHSEARRSQAS